MLKAIRWLALAVLLVLSSGRTMGGEPLVVAHRGLLQHAPENTLANFRACLELRLGFEFDVARTKDGQLVCIHDDTVDRTTDGKGQVSQLTLAEIQRLDAGGWFDAKFAGEKVPTIEQVMQLIAEYPQPGVLMAVDLKAEGVEEAVVSLAKKYQVLPRLLFIGRAITQPQVRATLRRTSTEVHIAVVANNASEFTQALDDPHADWLYFRYLPPLAQVQAVHKLNKRTFIAGTTVSGHVPTAWQQVREVGLDGILTDYSLELAALLRKPTRPVRE